MRKAVSSARIRGVAWVCLGVIFLALAWSAGRDLTVTVAIPGAADLPAKGLASMAALIGVTEIVGRGKVLRGGIWVRDRALRLVDVLNRRGTMITAATVAAVPFALDALWVEDSPPGWVQGAGRVAVGFAVLSLCLGPGTIFAVRLWVQHHLQKAAQAPDLNYVMRLHDAPGGVASPFQAIYQYAWGQRIVTRELDRIAPRTTTRLLEELKGFLAGKQTEDPDRVRLRRLLNDGPVGDIQPWLAQKIQIDSAWGVQVLSQKWSEGAFTP